MKRKVMPWIVGVLTLIILGVAGIAVYVGLDLGDGSGEKGDITSGHVTVDGTSVHLEEAPSKKDVKKMAPQALDGDLVVPSVGMSTSLASMNEVGGVINPPGLTKAYMVRGHGTPDHPEKGTTYIAVHSVQGANLPGNKLIKVAAAKPAVHPGETITAQGHDYTITKAYAVNKSDISGEKELWADEPDKLVILTCLQRTSGRSVQNIVIVADRD